METYIHKTCLDWVRRFTYLRGECACGRSPLPVALVNLVYKWRLFSSYSDHLRMQLGLMWILHVLRGTFMYLVHSPPPSGTQRLWLARGLLLELNRGGVWGGPQYKIKYFKLWHTGNGNLINFTVIVFARWRLCMSSMFLLLPIFGSNVIFAKLLYLIVVSFPYMSLITINNVGIFVCTDDVPLL